MMSEHNYGAGKLKAKRVAIYMPSFNSGGVQRMHINLAPRFIAAGIDVTFVVHKKEGALVPSIPPGVRVVELGAKRTLGAILPLRRWLKSNKVDILVANMGHPNMVALLARGLSRTSTKVIASQRNHLTNQSSDEPGWQHKILPHLYRRYLGYADGVIAVSEGVKSDLVASTGINPHKITVIYNPAVPDDVEERAACSIEHTWFNDGKPIAVAAGRLVRMKDYPTMLQSLAQIPELRLAIMGEGPLRAELDDLAQQLGISDRVDFLGFQSNPFGFFARASVFVLTSKYEGFGNVLAEALACGTPIVATDCESGPAEILGHGEYGNLAKVGDVDGIASSINSAISSNDIDKVRLRKERSKMFTINVAAESYMRLFNSVMGI